MANVYQSLRDVVQDTFQRGKANTDPAVRAKSNTARTLDAEVAEIETLLVEKIGRLKARVIENEEWAAGEAKHAEDIIDSLTANVAALETKIKEAEEAGRAQNLARQKTEENLNATIDTLQKDLKSKAEALESRTTEVDHLNSKIDFHVKQAAELSASVETVKAEAAEQAKRLDNLVLSSNTEIVSLESRLADTENTVREKDSIIKNLHSRVADLQTQLISKDEQLTARDTETNALKSQLKALTGGIEQMALLFKRAEAIAAADDQGPEPLKANDLNTAETKTQASPLNGSDLTPVIPQAAVEPLSDGVFGQIIHELSQQLNVIGVVASMIVREHVTALGESMENFPRARLSELLESLGKEILDKNLKVVFSERLANV